MLTASEALARDVPVLAVPGHPTAPAAAGPLDLLSDGAIPVRDVTDVLVAIGRGRIVAPPDARIGKVTPSLGRVAADVLERLDSDARTLGELVLAGPDDLEVVSGALVELEQAGLVVRSGAWFERAAGPSATRTGGAGS